MTLLAVAVVWRHGKADRLDLATQDCMRERVSVNFTEMRDIAGALPTTFAMARLVVGPALRINRCALGLEDYALPAEYNHSFQSQGRCAVSSAPVHTCERRRLA